MVSIPEFSDLRKNLKKDFSGFSTLRMAILGDSATQLLVQALKGYAWHYKINLEIFEADFNQIERQVFDPNSELYDFKPEVVILFHAAEKLLLQFYKHNIETRSSMSQQRIQLIENLYEELQQQLGCKVIYYNYCEIDNTVFGNYSNKIASSFISQLRHINYSLMQLTQQKSNLFIGDISYLQNQLGRQFVEARAIYINTDMVFSLDFLPYVAKATLDIIAALRGQIVKCVIVDLDNTLWGGVIGDDGVEGIQIGTLGIGKAFTEFQYWLKCLKERGIILAVCSKNTESVARHAFETHPEMVLKLEDFSLFVANWDNKADNIRMIKEQLNIGYDSIVFLDDNPFERNIVRENIPEIQVPELPEDPAEYLSYLYSLNLFETATFSQEDANRTAHYQIEALRQQDRKSFTDERGYLASLQMISNVENFTAFNMPRVAQLSQRSNQFNLRTIRYTEEDIKHIAQNEKYFTLSFTLEDKYGDNGLICVLVLKRENDDTWFIETWLMSCRVLKRGMEDFVLNTIVNKAKQHNIKTIKGEYIPSGKNELVKNHYSQLGFVEQNGFWYLSVQDYKERENFIKKNNKKGLWKERKYYSN